MHFLASIFGSFVLKLHVLLISVCVCARVCIITVHYVSVLSDHHPKVNPKGGS